ncbi:MAG: GPR endopeptidase [Bacilli bacterium]|nr:GPR endopeptidase [Bacilli bacterium]
MKIRTDLSQENENHCHTIHFHQPNHALKEKIKKEIAFFLNKYNFSAQKHIFIIGLGNDFHTADSIGPKTIKHIPANAHLEKLGVNIRSPKISLLEPGVLGTTGIPTIKTIQSVTKEIKPDLILLIDALVTDNVSFLNHTIQITDEGILPGSGLKGSNEKINQKNLGIPVIAIGIPTAIEYINKTTLLVSSSDIDLFIQNTSLLLAESINELLHSY